LSNSVKYIISIVGPTAIGKTDLAIKLANYFGTEIISADSRQFYSEISIGTAKPNAEELSSAKHHFIGNLSIHQNYSAGDFERDALKLLDEIYSQNKLAVMVGGSGLYLKAVWEGLHELPTVDNELRNSVIELYETGGLSALQEKLKTLDSARFLNIDTNNPQRLMRAIEIAMTSDENFAGITQNAKVDRPFKNIKIGLKCEREKLYSIINSRVDKMMELGLFDECKKVFELRKLNSLQTVGYKEIFDHLEGNITLEKAVELIKQHTRNFAKRQLTWFNKDTEIKWFEPHNEDEILSYIKANI